MKYRSIIRYIAVFCVAMSVMLSATLIKSDEVRNFSYEDVLRSDWYYDSVNTLCSIGVLPSGEPLFYGNSPASRGDMVLYLYNLALATDKSMVSPAADAPFADITRSDKRFDAVCWAYANGIVKGFSDTTFNPDGQCTREEMCTIAMRFLTYMNIRPAIAGNTEPFFDSLSIREFARSYVVSAKLCGVVTGDGRGYFRPIDAVTRAELCKMLCSLYTISLSPAAADDEFVDTTDGAYAPLYEEYERGIQTLSAFAVKQSPAVDVSYFDDVAFVGDSVSMSLQYYCASSKALGNAVFLCAGSLSPLNAHWEVSDESKHPVYKGKKMTVEDAVAACGAGKVYIMLGVNSIAFGLEDCVNDMVLLADKIIQKSPDVKIILQSVTPMTKTSPIRSSKLNNDIIRQYNQRMVEIALQRGWYYVNVAEAVSDKDNYLRPEFCSDPASMGIHFNFEADKAWIEYLKTHTPVI